MTSQLSNFFDVQKTFWMSTNSTIQATKFWRIQYNARFDLINQNLVSHTFSIYRDLHCWELSMNWTPNGYAQGINFKLNVKSPTLRDLKIEKKGGIFSKESFIHLSNLKLVDEKLKGKKKEAKK